LYFVEILPSTLSKPLIGETFLVRVEVTAEEVQRRLMAEAV